MKANAYLFYLYDFTDDYYLGLTFFTLGWETISYFVKGLHTVKRNHTIDYFPRVPLNASE
jgi:hypothetical protein